MTSKVYVALRVKASPERAFAAFVEEIGDWWRPSGLFQTTPRPGRLSFEPGEGGRLIETRVSVEHRGFDQVPAGAARHGFPDLVLLMRLADFWRAQISAIGERLG